MQVGNGRTEGRRISAVWDGGRDHRLRRVWHIRLAAVASTIAFATSLTGSSLASASRLRDAPLSGNALVVDGEQWLVGGLQLAAEESLRAAPEAIAARERSRRAYAHLTASQVRELLDTVFPAVAGRQAGDSVELLHGVHVAGYLSVHALQLALPGHRLGIAESLWPVAARGPHGRFAPLDLELKPAKGGFAPARSDILVRIPRMLAVGVRTPSNGVSLTPTNQQHRPLSGHGAIDGAAVVYANTGPAADTIVKPTPTGFQIDAVLRSPASPQQLFFEVGAPVGSKLIQDPLSGVVSVVRSGRPIARIMPPGAQDAAGTTLPATMSVAGDTLVVDVEHRAGSYRYPIDVDPEINDSQLATTSSGKRSNWMFRSSNEAKFGHSSVYEGPGKERLETTGIAEYGISDFAYWAYETKGNSKIYELKTKTSAKNKGAKIESFLQFVSGSGNENKLLLSTESEGTSEYAEKASTICGWNASKVEECLPGSGKEKNAVRFQQSATGSPGANYKFSDTLSEAIVSISEPAGEHSSASFNTTSPEIEGEVEVEGKKVVQKRTNALYGAGSWLSKFKGALQFIAKDPGIGVSATRLEYEKSAGKWEQLSSHNYLEAENGCQGVQCYVEHTEYWTLDPKLPDGEDKVRYRAEEAIPGTISPESEAESNKTIKVDTAPPHGILLHGLPWGNELAEKPYKLSAQATDGEGTTVASSGVKSLTLFVSGHEIAEVGKQVGCSIAKGACTATAEWSINGAELGAGHHAIVVVATDNAGNESRLEETISINHSTPVRLGPGSVDLQSGDYALGATDTSMGSGLTIGRNYSSRAITAGKDGPLGLAWTLDLGTSESLVELVDGGVLLTDSNGAQTIFASLGGGEFESPNGDSNLKLTLEENKTTKQKLAYYLKNTAAGSSVKFTQPTASTAWVPTKQEGTVATDTVTYSYQTVEHETEYPLHAGTKPTKIILGPDGNLWYAAGNFIDRMTIAGPPAVEYPLPSNGWAAAITSGPDGNVWFLNSTANTVGKMTTTGTVTEYPLGGKAGTKYLTSIAPGPDGNLWFTSAETSESVTKGKIGKVSPTGVVTEYNLPSESEPIGIVAGPDGNMWFVNEYCGSRLEKRCAVGKITTSGVVTEYNISGTMAPMSITAGPDGNLWVSGVYGTASKIAKVTTSGTFTIYSLPTSSYPVGIAKGPDGNLWFVDELSNKVGKITTSGTVTEYALPPESEPRGITTGPDGNLWFADYKTNRIGTITPSGLASEPAEVLAPVPAGVSCSPEMKAGCRSLKLKYGTAITATSENSSGWGEYRGRLKNVLLDAYDPVSKKMQETTVAEYSYDKAGRLRAVWDPRLSPALKTTYGYDEEGHVTALTSPGQQSWTFIYGTIAGDAGTGRLLKVAQAPASTELWGGESPKNTEAPKITGSALVGVRLAVSNGKWSGGPVSYGYQWEDCEAGGSKCSPIVGANNANYTPAASDIGHTLVALVTAINGGGSVAAATAATASVQSELTEYALPSGSHPFGITSGPDGNLWFTDTSTGKVGKITTSGTLTEYATEKDEPEGIASGPDNNLWFVEHSIRHVNHMTTSGALTVYTLTRTSTYNVDIAKGPDENLWFTESQSNYIGRIKTNDEIAGEYALPASSKPYEIALGPDNNLWFTDNGTSKVGKITTAGVITEYALPAGSQPRGISSGAGGKLYVDDYGTSKISQVTTAGALTEYSLPAGSQPNGIVSGPDGNVWVTEYGTSKILKLNPNVTEGEAVAPVVGYALEYGTPLSGSGLPNMTEVEVAKWGQSDDPVEATAILAPDADQGWPATSYTRASVYYLDAQGRTVNVANPSNATYGSVLTTEYNETNDVVRTLSPDNRQIALASGGESADVAKLLSTYYSYREMCSRESENNHETESLEPGARLCDVEGPQHLVKYVSGGEQKESLARLHTKYFYDENAPLGETYNLVTRASTLAKLANEEEVEVRKTVTSYSGQSNLGWKLRAPTSVTVDPEGKKLTTTTLYNSSTGQVTEARAPAGSAGGSAHDSQIIYYTSAANTEGYPGCGSHPEWAGLLCETLPAKQPESGGPPQLPVIVVASYNVWNEPLVVTETFGPTVRSKTKSYDSAGRLATSETTSSADVSLPKVTDEYNSKTGQLEKQSTTVASKTTTITSKYSTAGQLTEYIDGDGNIAKYRYGGPENDWLLEEMTDGSNSGTGRQTYTYNSTTKLREELWDSAAGTFSATYDADGKLAGESYPNAMCTTQVYNSVGEPVHIEYKKTTDCTEGEAPVWFSESRTPSVRGETLSRTSTLASETYAYDTVGRLTEAHETPAGEGCSTRLYAYDEESNRTSQTTRAPGVEGKCAVEGGTTVSHSYDTGNRLTDSGIAYDSFGNVTELPAADAEGHELSSTFYVDNAVATQSQNGVTNNYYLDPEGRVRETIAGLNTTITHYDGSGEAVAWTSESEGKSTRNIPGIDGTLVATQANGATPVLQLHDLEGDIVATAALSTLETKLLSTYNSTEFGVPNGEKAPPKYAWLGAGDVASVFSSGVVTYGATSYVPQTGRTLQSESVEPPGAPQGTGAGAPYTAQEEPWVFQGAAEEAAEAPGLEAAREQAALEASATAIDPMKVYDRLTARAVGKVYLKLKTLEEVLGLFDIPLKVEDVVEKYILDKLGMDQVLAWLHDAGEKLVKCSNNKRVLHTRRGPLALASCAFGYGLIEFSFKLDEDIKFNIVNFWEEPWVLECAFIGPENPICPAEVHIEKEVGS